MIDINNLRIQKGGDPEEYKKSIINRFKNPDIIDKLLEVDDEWIKAQFILDNLKQDLNKINKKIGQKKKEKIECNDLINEAIEIKELINNQNLLVDNLYNNRNKLLLKIPNLLHPSVPISNSEENNMIIKINNLGKNIDNKNIDNNYLKHYELIEKINGLEQKQAAIIVGHRGYYLKGYAAMLNQALLQYASHFLIKKDYQLVQPPLFIRRGFMEKAAELDDFNETLYKISMDKDPSEDLFLIATSEQPLCCLHYNETFNESDLPIKYVGLSSCFRREAGAHGKDMRGIFRIHQFEKVEQFVLSKPEESWDMLEQIINTSSEFYESLGIPYRIISIVSGALNNAASKKYDLEAWFPGLGEYKELVSCSNCTDYQSRALNIKLNNKKEFDQTKNFVHLLNGTMCASERTLCALLENHQTPTGINIPDVLVPYLGGIKFIKYQN